MSFLLAQSMAAICCCDSLVNSGPLTGSRPEGLALAHEETGAVGSDMQPLNSISENETTNGAYL